MKLSNIVVASLIASSVSGCMENKKQKIEQPTVHQDSTIRNVVTPIDNGTTKPKTERVAVSKDSVNQLPTPLEPKIRHDNCPACGRG